MLNISTFDFRLDLRRQMTTFMMRILVMAQARGLMSVGVGSG